jgi:uncharacterized SAM-binding protein YcdF (DUF218 family)
MLFYAGKFVQFLVSPLNLSIGLSLLALALGRRRPGARNLLVFAGVALLWGSSTNFAAYWLMRGLERQYPILPAAQFPSADAIVLLGGTVYPVEPPRVEAEEMSGSRAVRAARLFHAGKAPKILCAGGVPYEPSPGVVRNEAVDMRELLQDLGVPASAVVLEENSRNTAENAMYAARILKESGNSSVLLVTSAFHMPRAVALFEKEGLQVVPAPSDVRATGDPWRLARLLPTPEALKLTTLAVNEYVGYWGYRLLGRL